MEEANRNLRERQLKTEKPRSKDVGKIKEKEEKEIGGRKTWVLLIFVITIILGLIFSLQARRGQLSAPSRNLQLPEFNLNLFGSKEYRF